MLRLCRPLGWRTSRKLSKRLLLRGSEQSAADDVENRTRVTRDVQTTVGNLELRLSDLLEGSFASFGICTLDDGHLPTAQAFTALC